VKFPYFKLPLKERSEFFGTSILKPIIPVEIGYEGQPIRYNALVDSGADFCIFDAQIGEALGINVRSGKLEKFGGIQSTGPGKAYLHQVVLNIGGWPYKATVSFSYDIAPHGYGILGQKGFFDIFSVKFDLSKEVIELKEQK